MSACARDETTADCVAKRSHEKQEDQRVLFVETLVGRTLDDVERELILATLRYYRGNRTHAANMLGISIRSMRNRIRRYRSEGATVWEPKAGLRNVPNKAVLSEETRGVPSPDSAFGAPI